MQKLDSYILEKLQLNKQSKVYKEIVNDADDLKRIIKYRYTENNKEIDATDLDVSAISDFHGVFSHLPEVKVINVTGWDISNADFLDGVFFDSQKLEKIIGLDTWQINKAKQDVSLSWMFAQCSALKEINLSGLNSINVTELSHMCFCCSSLEKIIGIENWDVTNVTLMNNMFTNCVKLKSVDLSNWKPQALKRVSKMFLNCKALTSIGNIDHWENPGLFLNPQNRGNNMQLVKDAFDGCDNLQDIPIWAHD